MEELDLKDIFSFFLSKIYIVVIITFCCVVVSMMYGMFLKTPMYRSSTTLVLAGSLDNDDSTITQSEITLNQKLVSTYREIIKSRLILGQVIQNLKLTISPDTLSKNVTVTTESDTEIIKITVSNQNANTARDIANEIASVFSKEIVDIYNIKNCRVIDKAVAAISPYNIQFIKQITLTVFLALLLSFADIFVLYYFDTTIKSGEDIEKKVQLPILGSVPDSVHKGGRRK